MNKNYRERLEEASEWLRSMYDLLSLKTDVEDIEFTQKRIDLLNWMIEQINRLYGGETFKGYKEMYEYSERIKNNALVHVQELEELVEDYKAINKELHQRGKKVRKQNKRYREILESQIMKDLIRLEDKGCFLPNEKRAAFANFKHTIETLEGDHQ